jgi:hypothetical protein
MFVEEMREKNRNSIKSIFKSDTLGGNSCNDIVLWGRITIAIKVIIIKMMMMVSGRTLKRVFCGEGAG